MLQNLSPIQKNKPNLHSGKVKSPTLNHQESQILQTRREKVGIEYFSF